MAVANQSPASIAFPMAQVVNFTTTNLSNGNTFVEPHTVSGPNGSFTVPLNAINIGGNKVVVPLTSDTSPGAYYLKFHMPQPGSSEFYVTFAQKNLSYSDGYYDYTTGIPTDYRSDLRTFIADGATSIPTTPHTRTKTLVFMVYGLDTNQTSAAVQFTVKFTAQFGFTSSSGSGSSDFRTTF